MEVNFEESLASPTSVHNQENLSIRKVCVNCELGLDTEDEVVTEFLAVFSDCERNVSLADALGSVFALRKQQMCSRATPTQTDTSTPVVLPMCVKCAEIMATLYKAYVELMEQSKVTAHLTRVIRQVQLWHLQHGHTLPNDFFYPSKEESDYRYINSVLAVEFMGEEDEGEISEDDIPLSARKLSRNRDSQLSADNRREQDNEDIGLAQRKIIKSSEIRTIPKKRKILSQIGVEGDVQEDLCEEFDLCSKSVSRRKSSIPVKRPIPGDQSQLEDTGDIAPLASLKRKIARRRGRPSARLPIRGKRSNTRKPKKKTRALARIRKICAQQHIIEIPLEINLADTAGLHEEDTEFLRPGISARAKLRVKGKAHMVKVPKIDCPHCDSKFIYNWMLENHILSIHEAKPPLDCNKCGLQFFKEDLLIKHTCIAREVQEEERKKRPHSCKQCGKTFLLLKHVKQHYKCHDEDKPFQCSQCSSSFKSENFLRFHEKLHSEEKSWQCSICGKVFHVKRNLTIHMDIHEAEKKYLCSLCGMPFAQQKALRRHISAQHEPTLKHKCPICGKGFKRKDHITQHLSSKVHPKPTILEPNSVTEGTASNISKGRSAKAATTNAHPVSTSNSVFTVPRPDSTQILQLQPSVITHCPPTLFHPISHSHFLANTSHTVHTVQNPRPATDFGFPDFISFE